MSKGLKVPTNPAMALRELNAQHATHQEEDTNNTTILQTDKLTNQNTNQRPDLPTNLPTDSLRNKPIRRPANKQAAKLAHKSTAEPPPPAPQLSSRIDGRTLRVRQETSDSTMVTSMRLSVSTVDLLDEFCWRHRQRKQDVIQEALTLYFQAMAEQERK